MRRYRLAATLMALALCIGCGSEGEDGQTVITFENTGSKTLLLSGNESPFEWYGVPAAWRATSHSA